MTNSEDYKELIERKGKELLDERESFLNNQN